MLAGIRFEQPPKVGTTRRQHNFVCRKRTSITGQRDIDEVFFISQVSKRRQNRRMEVIPAQRVLLLGGGVAPHRAKGRCNLYAND